MCKQNQFAVQMFMKPVYSTNVHTDYTRARVEPKQLQLNWKSWKSKSCKNFRIDDNTHIPHIVDYWAAPLAAKNDILPDIEQGGQ